MSDYLLVPTNIQAFAVGKPGEQVYDLAPVPRTEDDVANWFVEGKYAFSLQNKISPIEPGIHLHWALPNALTHSRHDGDGETEQPCIPNRWLVVRMWRTIGDSTVSTKAWVVESDYVSLDAASGGAPFSSQRIHRPNSAASIAVTLAAPCRLRDGEKRMRSTASNSIRSAGVIPPSPPIIRPAGACSDSTTRSRRTSSRREIC